MNKKKKDTLRQLLMYAGNYKGLTFLGMALSKEHGIFRRMTQLQAASASFRI